MTLNKETKPDQLKNRKFSIEILLKKIQHKKK